MIKLYHFRVHVPDVFVYGPMIAPLTLQGIDELLVGARTRGIPHEIWMTAYEYADIRKFGRHQLVLTFERELLQQGVQAQYQGLTIRTIPAQAYTGTRLPAPPQYRRIIPELRDHVWIVDDNEQRLAQMRVERF